MPRSLCSGVHCVTNVVNFVSYFVLVAKFQLLFRASDCLRVLLCKCIGVCVCSLRVLRWFRCSSFVCVFANGLLFLAPHRVGISVPLFPTVGTEGLLGQWLAAPVITKIS